jgi:hypothetical protein
MSPRVHIQTPNAKAMDVAIREVFAAFGIPPLGGQSADGWSKVSDFLRCPYRYFLRYELGAEVPDAGNGGDPNLEVGSLVHVGLAVHYASMLPQGAPGWHPNYPSPLDFLDAVEASGVELGHVVRARQLLYGYWEHYNPDNLEPLAIEVPAGIEGVHTSRFDMVARRDDGTWITEHKSSYRETEEVIEGWYLDGEVVGEVYSWRLANLSQKYGPLAGVLINLLFKTNPPKFRRLEVPISSEVVEWYARDRAHWGSVRDHYRNIGYWPRKLTGCFSYNRFCGYRPHCRDGSPTLVELRRKPKDAP